MIHADELKFLAVVENASEKKKILRTSKSHEIPLFKKENGGMDANCVKLI